MLLILTLFTSSDKLITYIQGMSVRAELERNNLYKGLLNKECVSVYVISVYKYK